MREIAELRRVKLLGAVVFALVEGLAEKVGEGAVHVEVEARRGSLAKLGVLWRHRQLYLPLVGDANAVTKDGQIVNIDGYSNRVSAIAFGPKKVIMIVGKNKIVDDLNAATVRIKTEATSRNCIRLNKKTPCATLGKCVCIRDNYIPQIYEGCSSPDRICRNVLISGPQVIKDRINVIIVNESLGY